MVDVVHQVMDGMLERLSGREASEGATCDPTPLLNAHESTSDGTPFPIDADVSAASGENDEGVYTYHALRDFRVIVDEERNDCEQVEVEWDGGVISWHDRSSLECEDTHDELATLARWHEWHRNRLSWKSYRRQYYGRPRFTAGGSKVCGFDAVKATFTELGYCWVTDKLVADYIASGRQKNKNYAEGIT